MKKTLIFFVFFILFAVNNAFAHTNIVYSYPAVGNDNQCKSKAVTALKKSGYTVTSVAATTTGENRHISAKIVCSVANRHGVAFIILTSIPEVKVLGHELSVLTGNFTLAK